MATPSQIRDAIARAEKQGEFGSAERLRALLPEASQAFVPQQLPEGLVGEDFAPPEVVGVTPGFGLSPIVKSADIKVTDPLALRDIAVTGIIDPAIASTGYTLDFVAGTGNTILKGLSALESAAGDGQFFEELQQSYQDAVGMPSEVANSLRLDIKNLMDIPDPELRAEIAVQKTADYASYFSYYKAADILLNRVPGLKRLTKPVFDFFNKEMKKRPGLFVASEAAGVAAETELKARGFGEGTQAIGGVVGNLGLPATFKLISRYVPKLTDKEYLQKYGRDVYDKAAEMYQTFALKTSDEIGETGRVIDGSPEIIETINKRLELPIDPKTTPLEILTGSAGMGELEVYLLKQAGAINYLNRRDKAYLKDLSELLPKRSNTKDLAEFFRLDRKIKQIQLNLDKSISTEKSLEILRRQNPDASTAEINQAIVNGLLPALERGRIYVDRMWAATDLTAKASAKNAKKTLEEIKNKPGIVYNEEIPDLALRYLDGDIPLENVGDVYSLYSGLGSFIVNANKPNSGIGRQAILYAQQIRDGLLKDLTDADLAGKAAIAAKDATADFHKLYSRGATGKILGLAEDTKTVAPDPRIAVTQTVKGADPAVVDVSIEQIARGIRGEGVRAPGPLTKVQQEVMDSGLDGVTEFYQRLFYDAAIDPNTGEVMRLAARNFLTKHADFFAKPENSALKLQLETAVDEVDALRRVITEKDAAFKSLYSNESVGALNKFLNANIDNRLQSILFKGDPAGQMNELMELINKASPKTLKQLGISNKAVLRNGLANAIGETLTRDALKRVPLEGGPRLTTLLQNPAFVKALRKGLNETEINNIRTVASEIDKYNVYRLKTQQVMPDEKANILQQILGGIAAIGAGKVTGGPASIQMAGAAKRGVINTLQNLSKGQLQQILADATTDPKLLKALLMNERTYIKGGKIDLKSYLTKYFISRGIAVQSEQSLERAEQKRVNLSAVQDNPTPRKPLGSTLDMLGK